MRRQIEEMRHHRVRDPAAVLAPEPPARTARGVALEQILREPRDLDLAQCAEMPVVDQLLESDDGRDVAKLERDHVRDAGTLRFGGHLFGLRERQRERLLAQHVFSGVHGRQHRAVVIERRRGDGDDVELDAAQHLLDRVKRVRDLPLARHAIGARGRGDRDDVEARVQRVRRRVHRAAEPRPDDPDLERAHRSASVSRTVRSNSSSARASCRSSIVSGGASVTDVPVGPDCSSTRPFARPRTTTRLAQRGVIELDRPEKADAANVAHAAAARAGVQPFAERGFAGADARADV